MTRDQLNALMDEIGKHIQQLEHSESVGLTPWWLIQLTLAAEYAFAHGYGFDDSVPVKTVWS